MITTWAGHFLSTAASESEPGPELITNGTFADASNWTLSTTGEDIPTIGSGRLNLAITDGVGSGTQTLVAGSQAAGDFQVTLDVPVKQGGTFTVFLLGASNENRGSQVVAAQGLAQQFTIAASGEVTKLRISYQDGNATADNVSLTTI